MIITKLPLHSPKAVVEQTIGVTDIRITYHRPSVKGRAIFGSLVPFDQLWRTAANAGTVITFEHAVVVEGAPVPAGQYALLAIPGADRWQIMLNRSTKSILAVPYDETLNVVSFSLPVETSTFTESFTIGFENLVVDGATITLAWDRTKVSFHVLAPATEQALKNIDEALAEPDATPGNYHNAAAFCLDRKVRLEEALAWCERSVAAEPKFFTVRTLSLLYAAHGMKQEAIGAAKRSVEMSKAAGFTAFVEMNEAKIREWEEAVA
jgi:tetratricopeptide (TPR) repeat protein